MHLDLFDVLVKAFNLLYTYWMQMFISYFYIKFHFFWICWCCSLKIETEDQLDEDEMMCRITDFSHVIPDISLLIQEKMRLFYLVSGITRNKAPAAGLLCFVCRLLFPNVLC